MENYYNNYIRIAYILDDCLICICKSYRVISIKLIGQKSQDLGFTPESVNAAAVTGIYHLRLGSAVISTQDHLLHSSSILL